MSSMNDLRALALELNDLHAQYSRLGWTQYTTGYDFGVMDAYKKFIRFFENEKNYNTVLELKEKETTLSFEDRRRVEIMFNQFEPYHLSKECSEMAEAIEAQVNELSKILNTFRFKLDGKEITSVEISNILTQEEDSAKRKAAFYCRGQIDQPLVDGGFLNLIKLRKEYAKLRGEKDFVELKLKEDGLDSSVFNGWKKQLQDLLPEIKQKRSAYAKKYNNGSKIMPWDEQYVSSKIAPLLNQQIDLSDYYENIRDFFKIFDINIDEYNITYDVFPRKNKSEWGYNFPIETCKDSRILANIKNRYFNYGVLLHETGHAVHSYLNDPEKVILNFGINGIVTEGIANLFGHFMYDEIFFNKFFNDQKEEAIQQFKNLKEYNNLKALFAITSILFDQELYRNPVNSLDDIYSIYWKIHKDLFDEEPYSDIFPWGFRIHHTTHPIYLHNYFMGDVTCEMLSKVFSEKHGGKDIADNPVKFKNYLLKEVINPSGLYKYNELFERISGDQFSLKYIL
ncbi:gluzincin family metallopeptidase [Vallitalea okinawensis]|uniref:M3 family metallopeptidase n=1 Tax=Vallitalea okinawensis TaxID=2078660 RepID=UPI000CFB7252|nr:M3 family metallopeptidase [Vallitalea okinawensis]